ncbi:hypothetical protein GII36_04455 [Candidatus Mycosynbacter amalyticus]|uniref:Uncharacterized protein n=1 Tax=Candidatus Mycosynbacter amalyticus TaxID=2665156 RepID=A0A857MR27_9BACT|nr:hypothetical protein [Candidatus Mycosynbacter amalyticus]QHN43080.1 hypothetical protein GII36_04455 [Candidatus Mycosynbacter amalyticus]
MGFMPGCNKPDWKCRAGDTCSYCQRQLNRVAQEAETPPLRNRSSRQGQATYGRGSQSGGYGRSAYSMRSGTFDGLPSLSRKRDDGAIEIFYQEGSVDMDDESHGHAVIKDGRLIYKREPGEKSPAVDR